MSLNRVRARRDRLFHPYSCREFCDFQICNRELRNVGLVLATGTSN
jgi:hypothetical protein